VLFLGLLLKWQCTGPPFLLTEIEEEVTDQGTEVRMFTAYIQMTVNEWGGGCHTVNASVTLTGRKGKDKRTATT
jgi:hypothetical protein